MGTTSIPLRLRSAAGTVEAGVVRNNAHIHWHVAPLPPGVPYERQQYHALMAEHGVLPQTPHQRAALATRIRAALTDA
jgi:hypothetical protein